MRLPDFLIIGTAKAGTTSLFYYLLQHPRIFMPSIKETFFFSHAGMNLYDFKSYGDFQKSVAASPTDVSKYASLFENIPAATLCGEAGTMYLASESAPRRIQEYIPQAKLIAILRNPVERAYSNYQFLRRDGHEPIDSFEKALDAEAQRIKENWFPTYYYSELGFYARQLKRYYAIFPSNQIRIFLYEDLQTPDKMVSDIFNFLGLPGLPELNTSARVNISGTPRIPGLYNSIKQTTRLKSWIRSIMQTTYWSKLRANFEAVMLIPSPRMASATRQRLIDLYQEDIQALQGLINRDLSSWSK